MIDLKSLSTTDLSILVKDITEEIHRRTNELCEAECNIDSGISRIQNYKCCVCITNDNTGEYVRINADDTYTIEID